MAKSKKKSAKPAAYVVGEADFKAVDAVRNLFAKVTQKTALTEAKSLGMVVTEAGIQRSLLALCWTLGNKAKEKVDVKPIIKAWADVYYRQDDASLVKPRKRPDADSMSTMIGAYQRFANLGAMPWDSWPVAQRAMAERNMALSTRGTKVDKIREAHAKEAPTPEVIAEAFKAPGDGNGNKNIGGSLKGLCSGVEKKANDKDFIAGVIEKHPAAAPYVRGMIENAIMLRALLTSDKAAATKASNALLAKIAGLPGGKKPNGKDLH